MFAPLSEYIELKLETAFYNKYHMLTYEESELWESYKEEFAEYLVGAFGDTTPKWDMWRMSMKLDWNKIVSNAVTVLVATVFMGAALQLWNGVQTIDSRIDANLVDIKATQSILAPKVDLIEKRLAEILEHLDRGDEITINPFDVPSKGSQELIDDERYNNQMIQQRGF